MAELSRQNTKRQTSYQEKHKPLPVSSVKNDFLNSSFSEYQKTMGNQAVQHLLESRIIRPKLKVSSPDDKYEKEADRVADQVMNMDETSLYIENEPIIVNFQANHTSAEMVNAPYQFESAIHSVTGLGHPLPQSTRTFFKPHFGDLSHVRVHTDAKASRVAKKFNALAFTVGNHIVFGEGKYVPESFSGKKLFAHELTHIVQQRKVGSAVRSPTFVQRQNEGKIPWIKLDEPLTEILPKGVGPLAHLNRVMTLLDIFGEVILTDLVLQIRRNPGAQNLVKEYGVPGIVALFDTGMNAPAAQQRLKQNPKDYSREALRRRSRKVSQTVLSETYWFQEKPPEKRKLTSEGIEIEPRNQVVVDPVERGFKVEGVGSITVRFAGMGYDFEGYPPRPKEAMKKGEEIVLEAIELVIKDLISEIRVSAPTRKQARAMIHEEERVRARLMEGFRELSVRPLNVFIATELTLAEKMSLVPLAGGRTEQIYVSADDIGNRSKLQAAVRIPLLVLVGGKRGVTLKGDKDWELTTVEALTPEQRKTVLLHEILHVFLINRSASANQLWENIGANLVKGTPAVKKLCEAVMHWYLLAQEEVFVYNNVGEISAEFIKNKEAYDYYIKAVNLFFMKKSVKIDQVKLVKLDVKERVGGKKVEWAISFKYPKSVSVTESDSSELQKLAHLYP